MALTHICDCGKEQTARISLLGVNLADGKKITTADEACEECDSVAEIAKKEALEKRKKKVS